MFSLILSVVILLQVSCSSQSATPAQTTPPPSLHHVTLRLNWRPGAEHAAYYVGINQGFYRDEGIDLEIIVGSGSADSVRLLATQQVDFALAAGANVIQGRTTGMPLTVVSVIYQDDPTSFTVLQNSGITNLNSLVGRRIGVAVDSSTFPEYLALLERNNLTREQFIEVPVTFGIEPLLTGQVDAFPGFLTQIPLQAKLEGATTNVIPFKDYGVNIYGVSIVTTENAIATTPDLVSRFVRASNLAWEYVIANQASAVEILVESVPELSADRVNGELTLLIPLVRTDITDARGLGYSEEARWQEAIDILYELGIITERIGTQNLYTNTFISPP